MKKFDVAIVGSGLAGMLTALHLSAERPELRIALITKSKLLSGNSVYAQGGIAAVMDMDHDSFSQHIEDTLKSGGALCDREIVEMVIRSAPESIRDLESWGVTFDKTRELSYHLGLEGGHSNPRIIHHADNTGESIMTVLAKRIEACESVSLFEDTWCTDILKNSEGIVSGIVLLPQTAELTETIGCKTVVLAGGGSGQVFRDTTNPEMATGDAIYLAGRVGAYLSNLRFNQFHPTAFLKKEHGRHFLISEAVRGFGAYIVNDQHERFLYRYDPRGELATRDIISKAILTELKSGKTAAVYLDCTHLDIEAFKQHFPTIYDQLTLEQITIQTDLIPITPVAHYQCGGVKVNECGQTSCENVFAVGECAETGLHGKNRLASNSLLEAVVFAKRVAGHIANTIDDINWSDAQTITISFSREADTFCQSIIDLIKNTMTAHFSIDCEQEAHQQGYQLLCKLERILQSGKSASFDRLKTESLLFVAKAIARDHLHPNLKKITQKEDKKVLNNSYFNYHDR